MQIQRGNHQSNVLFLEKVGLPKENHKTLEIGCGPGVMLKQLKEKGIAVKGIDTNEKYVIWARNELGLDANETCGEKLEFPDNSFDVILSFDVFEHIPDSELHLREVKRVLKKGGHYVLQTPNKITNVMFEIYKERSLTSYKRYHCSLHSYWGIRKRFKNSGFEVGFYDIPIVNEHFKSKVKKHFGKLGTYFLKIINPDMLPIYLKTNFYLHAKVKK